MTSVAEAAEPRASKKRRRKKELNRPKLTVERMGAREANLAGLRISTLEPLFQRANSMGREWSCGRCGDERNNNKFYCYDCLVPVGGLALPKLQLPCKLDVIRHPKENRKKSSALHAQVLCGAETVRTLDMHDCPRDYDPETTLLLFPSDSSTAVRDVPNLQNVERVVVVDSTWSQTRQILRLPGLQSLPRVHLKSYKTAFWRYQQHGDEFLSTLEAIYYFYREHYEALHVGETYQGHLDNLLYLYVGQFRIIQRRVAERETIKREASAIERNSESTPGPAALSLQQ